MIRVSMILFVVAIILVAPVAVSAQGPGETPVPTVSPTAITQAEAGQLAQLGYVALGALIGGAGALAAAVLAFRFILSSPLLISMTERLADSFPEPVKQALYEGGRVLVEASDSVPYANKQAGLPEDNARA